MAQEKPETVVYVSNCGDPSISVLAFDRAKGDIELIEKIDIPGTEEPSPTSMPLALNPDRRFLYAALRSEPFTIVSFAIDPERGKLTPVYIGPLEASMAYLTVDRTGKWLLAASYPSGTVTVIPLDADGNVGAMSSQTLTDRPKAHCIRLDGANEHAYCAVLEQDLILQMKFDAASGRLSPNTPSEIATRKGAGPRHLAFHPSGRFLYLVTETTATVGAYAVDQKNGMLRELQFVNMLPGTPKEPPAAADLHVTPDGKFLYGSERRSNILVGFRIDPHKGTLTLAERSATETTPRGFGIEPRGKFLLSVGLDSHNMTVYAIRSNGSLDPVKQHAMGKNPNWIEFADLQ
jgi:6-phosphogluconolactonase